MEGGENPPQTRCCNRNDAEQRSLGVFPGRTLNKLMYPEARRPTRLGTVGIPRLNDY